jgi:hypothetical protein
MHVLDPDSLTGHVDRLYRAAWGLCGSRQDAEDLVQETFARVLSRPRLLHGDEDLYYLMRVLRNTFITGRRASSRRPVTVATLDDAIAEDPSPIGRPERALEIRRAGPTAVGGSAYRAGGVGGGRGDVRLSGGASLGARSLVRLPASPRWSTRHSHSSSRSQLSNELPQRHLLPTFRIATAQSALAGYDCTQVRSAYAP